jgi:hypothetical protein
MTPEYFRTWRRDNFDKVRKCNRKYWARNAKRIAESRKAKRASNPNYGRGSGAQSKAEHARRYRARNKLNAAWLAWTSICAMNRRSEA